MDNSDNLSDEAKEIFQSFDNFKKAIVRIYGDSKQYKKAIVSIQCLQQIGSVQDYILKFYALSSKTEWDDDALTAIYYRSLKDPIKDELFWDDIPKDMDEIVKNAIRINN